MKRFPNTWIIATFFSLLSWSIVGANLNFKHIEHLPAPAAKASRKPPSKYVSREIWQLTANYVMPDDHPIKKKLDRLFSASRVFCNFKSMRAAGFEDAQPQPVSRLIVTRHPDFPGFVFKAYFDKQPYFRGSPEYLNWIKRVKGAQAIRKSIKHHQYQHLFKVPRKWLYLLPDNPAPPQNFRRKLFILVEEDMNIYDIIENREIWQSNVVTEELLDAFFTVITDVGLQDTKTGNCTFSLDGRIAFVDTESCFRSPIRHRGIKKYLQERMQKYWKNLFLKKGIIRGVPFFN